MPSAILSRPLLSHRKTGLRRMTLSAGVGTDDERKGSIIAALGRYVPSAGDGGAQPGGLAVYPAANAAVVDATLNGDFETNTTGWTADNGGAGTVSDDRITTDAKFGSACAETILDGASANQGVTTSALTGLTAGNVYTEQLRLKWVSGATAIRVQIDWLTVLAAPISSSTSDVTLTAAWQMFTLTATAPALGVHAKLRILNTAATATRFRRDGVQIDNGGVALPFDPPNTRVAGRVQLAVAGLLTATQGWAAVCYTAGVASTGLTTIPMPFSWREDATHYLLTQYASGFTRWFTSRYNGAGSDEPNDGASSFLYGATVLVFGRWTATGAGIAHNGGVFTNGGLGNIPTMTQTQVEIGSFSGGNQICGSVRWALLGKGTVTDGDSALMNLWGVNVPTIDQIRQLSQASKPTCLVPARTQDAILLPGYFR